MGLFLGPVATFLALDALSVISQTLLFALVLPLSALRGVSSRDGLSRALAKHLTQPGASMKPVGEETRDGEQPGDMNS